jgi:hypothetical protein
MDLQRPKQYEFTLTCNQRESEVVRTAIACPAMRGAREDFDRAQAHERLQRSLPQSSEPWKVALDATELIAIHRATRNLQYRQEFGDVMCTDAREFTDELVEKGYEVKYYLA